LPEFHYLVATDSLIEVSARNDKTSISRVLYRQKILFVFYLHSIFHFKSLSWSMVKTII